MTIHALMTVHCEAEWDRTDQAGETRWEMNSTVFLTRSSRMAGFIRPEEMGFWRNRSISRW
jgi:hypothetical protein